MNVEEILAAAEAAQQRRAEAMPTEKDAIGAMFAAWQRLKELGWREGQSAPTDGMRFAGIQCGSTGIHSYTAEKPDGPWARPMYYINDGDTWCSRLPPVLFRPWRSDDVQPQLRICAPIPCDEAQSSEAHGCDGSPARQGARPDGQDLNPVSVKDLSASASPATKEQQ